MPHIRGVLAVPSVGAGYCEDLAALQSRSIPVQDRYTAQPVTPGFRTVREPAEAVCVGLVLDTGEVAWGECVAVSYSGKAGRDPVFRSADGVRAVRKTVAPGLEGRELTDFRPIAREGDAMGEIAEGGVAKRPLHSAVRYGLSQALLQAVAFSQGLTMAAVIADEWGLPGAAQPVPIHAQSGSLRRSNADKMIVRRLASLPHALVDDIPSQMGADGSKMTQYIRWLRDRVAQLGGEEYRPTIHLDLHGALGQICDCQPGRMLGHLYGWEAAARPYPLRIESPVVMETREAQLEAMRTLREYVRRRGLNVALVADEWANTLDDIRAFLQAHAADMIQIKMPDLGSVHNAVDAVLACKAQGVGAFVGGSYAETDLSARVSVHVAVATRADLLMAKPGLDVDVAVSLVHNEMARLVATPEIGGREPVQ